MVLGRRYAPWGCGITLSIGILVFSSTAMAATIRFDTQHLQAALTLVQPEKMSVELDGREGRFNPGPGLIFAGLEPQRFEIDLNLGNEIVDLRFDHVTTKPPQVQFEPGRLRILIGIHDREKAIRSRFGAISVRNGVVSATARWASDGSGRLEVDEGKIEGELKGTGVLRPKWILNSVRNIVVSVLKRQLEKQLNRPKVQASIEEALLIWSRFSDSERHSRVLPATLQFSQNGLVYEVE